MISKKILVIDAIMGAGKTHKQIAHINKNPHHKFIFITPFLKEVERIKDNCYNFYEPNKKAGKGNKRTNFLQLVRAGVNVATTHSLFQNLELEDYKYFSDYVLIMDEVVDVISPISISKRDVELLINDGVVELVDDGEERRVVLLEDNYEGAFNKAIQIIKSGKVIEFNKAFLWMFPIEAFKSFKNITILTYLFEGSLLHNYLKYHHIEFTIISETKAVEKHIIKKIAEKLDVYEGKYNRIRIIKKGNSKKVKLPLSKTWYINADKDQYESITKATRNFFVTYCRTGSEFNAYTTFKDYKEKVEFKGYSEGFIPVNERATNKHRHKTSMAYLANRYMNPFVIGFLKKGGVPVNQDLWALGEMLQWIWRGCIRDNKEMKIYIPSARMRGLLVDWMNQ